MAVQITRILPPFSEGTPNDPISKHLAMDTFVWLDQVSQKSGTTSREIMYDFLVVKGGKAFIIKEGQIVNVFGAIATNGKKYIRAAKNKVWTDDLIDLQKETASVETKQTEGV